MGNNQKRVEVTDPQTGEVFGLNAGMLVSNVRDLLLSKRRQQIMATTWANMPEADQREEILGCTQLAEDLIAGVVDLVAAGGHDVIHAKLDNFKIKDGAVTLTAKGSADDGAVLALNHVGDKSLKIVVADAEQFDQQRDEAKAEPDQPALPIEQDEPDQMSDKDIEDIGADMDAQMDDTDDLHGDDAKEPGSSDEKVAGYHARMQGLHSNRNPYDVESDDRSEWYLGWKAADDSGDAPKMEAWPPVEDAEDVDQEPAAEDADAPDDEINAFEDGQAARLRDDAQDMNPYDEETDGHADWLSGWLGADDQVKSLIEEGQAAGEKGEPKKSCPWKKGTDAERFWLQGYEAGKKAA